jgi:hypothetical protein
VSSAELLGRDLNIERERWSPQAGTRVGVIMRRLGWTGPKLIQLPQLGGDGKPNGKLGRQERGYERPAQEDGK